ncbi:hypothetical protein LGH70_22670 [Hymenobacter sp. BT635]|uniref:Uncharacterized protein n=1 Tax=Hymenobacter nitidus TaxID=2880929 RepID=A0ABS8AK37_9BACT|nr:hypothetical protein [Hymenobacter nitidus]MCB2380414.1 hypothetical protein [Hymenobacter nitidus]
MSTGKPSFGKKVLAAVNERIEPTAAEQSEPAGEETVWVSFTTAVTRDTYMKLKQAEHWVPGFLMKELTETALVNELKNYPDAEKPLPAAALEKLLKSSKKLR